MLKMSEIVVDGIALSVKGEFFHMVLRTKESNSVVKRKIRSVVERRSGTIVKWIRDGYNRPVAVVKGLNLAA